MKLRAAAAAVLALSALGPAFFLLSRRGPARPSEDSGAAALALARAGTEKARQLLAAMPGTWRDVQDGRALADFSLDRAFSDLPSGRYAVAISSGPGPGRATVLCVSRERATGRTAAVEALLEDASFARTAAAAEEAKGLSVHGGSLIQPSSAPVLDLEFYRSSAQASGTFYPGRRTWSDFTARAGAVIFVDGDLRVGPPGLDILGTLVVTGSLTAASGAWGKGERADGDSRLGSVAVSGVTLVQGGLRVEGPGATRLHGLLVVQGPVELEPGARLEVHYGDAERTRARTTSIRLERTGLRELPAPAWPSGLP